MKDKKMSIKRNIEVGDIWECNDGELFYITKSDNYCISFIANYEGTIFTNGFDSTDIRYKEFRKRCKFLGKSNIQLNDLFKISK